MKKRISPLFTIVFLLVLLTACGSSSQVILPKDGLAKGSMGDTMRTYFFDYTVNSAYTCSKYNTYIPTPGYDLLAVEVTITNTHTDSLPMFDWDFVVLYSDFTNDEDIYDYPITSYEDVVISESTRQTLLPSEYTLEKEERRTGLLLFEVPAGDTEFTISYIESFEDDSIGDTFDVAVTATRK